MDRLKITFDVQLDYDITYGHHFDVEQKLYNHIKDQFIEDSIHIEDLNIFWYGDLKIARRKVNE